MWLVEAAASGTSRVRAKTARPVGSAAILGAARVDQALGLAAAAGRFDEYDLCAILDHLATSGQPGDLVVVGSGYRVVSADCMRWPRPPSCST